MTTVFSLSAPAFAANFDGIYHGTLGKEQIVVEIGADQPGAKGAPQVSGRYFYRRHGVGIGLKGTFEMDGSVHLTEHHGLEDTASGYWQLKFAGEAATGSFCKCDLSHAMPEGNRLIPIELTRVSSGFSPDLNDISDDAAKGTAPDQTYYDLLLDYPLITEPEAVTEGGYAYVMVKDPRFDLSMPRITRFPDRTVMSNVNRLLQAELKKYRLLAAGCLQGNDFNGGDFEVETEVTFFGPRLLNIVLHGGSFCGGAHPDSVQYVNTYDLRTGTEISVSDFLAREIDAEAVKKLTSKSHNPDKSAVPDDAASVLLEELYLQRYPHDRNECRDVVGRDDSGNPMFTTTQYFGHDGLVLSASLPHVAQACAETIVIPYSELGRFLRKDSQLPLLVSVK